MHCCADNPLSAKPCNETAKGSLKSQAFAIAAFIGYVTLTVLAASAVITSDLPLPWAGL